MIKYTFKWTYECVESLLLLIMFPFASNIVAVLTSFPTQRSSYYPSPSKSNWVELDLVNSGQWPSAPVVCKFHYWGYWVKLADEIWTLRLWVSKNCCSVWEVLVSHMLFMILLNDSFRGFVCFNPWPFRPKGYCPCLRLSVCPPTLTCPHNNPSQIWAYSVLVLKGESLILSFKIIWPF